MVESVLERPRVRMIGAQKTVERCGSRNDRNSTVPRHGLAWSITGIFNPTAKGTVRIYTRGEMSFIIYRSQGGEIIEFM